MSRIAIAVMSGLFLAVAVQAQENLVVNGGLEKVDAKGATIGWGRPTKAWTVGEGLGYFESRGVMWSGVASNACTFSATGPKLKAGRKYRVSVWIRGEDIKKAEPTAYLEWYGADGRYKGGVYARGGKGTYGWNQYGVDTTIIPTGIVRTVANVYAPAGMSGKAWFDNFSITELPELPPIDGLFSSRYRNAGAKGKVTFKAALNSRFEATGYFSHKPEGAAKFSPPVKVSSKDGVAEWTIDISELAMGDNVVRFALYEPKQGKVLYGSKEIVFTRQTPEEEGALAVRIDEHRRTIVNGKPFFPLGMYWGKINEKELKVYAESPFNCLMSYSRPDQKAMDLCQKYGIKVLYDIVNDYPVKSGKIVGGEPMEKLLRTLKRFRNHPALLAWYINDEMPISLRDGMNAARQLVADMDPNHPTWIAIYQHDQVREYLSTSDVIGTDPYPLFKNPISMVSEWTRNTRRGLMGMKPMWQIPQVFNKSAYAVNRKNPKIGGAPSEQEVKNMAWQCLAGGANGLVFYSFFDLVVMDKEDGFEKRFGEVKRVAKEIKDLERFFLSADPEPAIEGAPDALAIRAWRCGGETLIAAVNTTREPLAAKVKIDGVGMVDVKLDPIGVDLAVRSSKTEVMAVYYPHWHRYPKGDEWFGSKWDWSQGEWAFVKDAKEFFKGQINFRPYVGYLDGKNPDDVAIEIALAHNSGIDIFLYDYYWYNGEKTQEEAIEQGFLKAKNRNLMKFALMWCYHERKNPWRKKPGESAADFMNLAHTPEEFLGFIDYSIAHYFNQPEYWRYRGGLYFSIYNFQYLWKSWGEDAEKVRKAIAEARRRVRAAGLGELHLNAQNVQPKDIADFAALGVDSFSDYTFNSYNLPRVAERYRKGERLFDYSEIDGLLQKHWKLASEKSTVPYIPVVPTGWDASARCRRDQSFPWSGEKADYPYCGIFTNNTDEIFEKYLRDAKDFAENDPKHPGVVYINAWNEYTEGCWLLPDSQRNDYKLRAIARVFGRRPANRYVFTGLREYYRGDKAENGKLLEVVAPTVENVKYGSHERQGMDIWLPEDWRKLPKMPVVVTIHGGGWDTGDRISEAARWIEPCRKAKMALISISYRYLRDARAEDIVPSFAASMDDAFAAVRFIRNHATDWNLDPSRIGLTGGSAGACSSLYAALADDCALGVKAVLAILPQTSLDPKEVRGWMPNATYPAYATPYGTYDNWIAHYDEAKPWIEKYSPAARLRACTAAKAPTFLYISSKPPKPGELEKDPTHGSAYCIKFEELCKAKGVTCRRGTREEFLKVLE